MRHRRTIEDGLPREGKARRAWTCGAEKPLPLAWLGSLLFLVLFLGTSSPGRAQPIFSTEYEIKAALLFNLAQFVEWPQTAFPTPSSPIVIGVLGENLFGTSLEKVAEGEVVQNRKLVVRYYRRAADVQNCHILFISRSENNRLNAILSPLRGKPVLTVSDLEMFTDEGGMVRFVSEKNKVRLRMNLKEIEGARLKVSSKLLRIAELVSK